MSEIIHGFDIPSCCVFYDGKDVYFTNMSYFAHKNRINIVDVCRYSTTFESRLKKYMLKRFLGSFPLINPRNNLIFNFY